jgi:hypothetical protein
MQAPAHIARRFPLVARPRPPCRPLSQRVVEVRELAHAAGQPGESRLSLAAEAHNKAALIASDCGLPALARDLCWRQFEFYQRATPLSAEVAQLGLQPIVNLARLLIRGGDGQAAYRLLESLDHAARTRTSAVLDGHTIAFSNFIASGEGHHTLCRWLWTVLLGDGTRALANAGSWDQALAHAEKHHGVGTRLLDGRQVAVLAHCMAGDPASALAILAESTAAAPWEQAVAACLGVLCLTSDARPTDRAITAMVERYLRLDTSHELVVFHTRLGLTVIDLAGSIGQPVAARAAARLVNDALMAGDGYATRDILAHHQSREWLGHSEQQALSAAVESTGLGSGAIAPHLMADLLAAAEMSEAVMAQELATLRAEVGQPQ